MTPWSNKDKAAVEEGEFDPTNLGAAANDAEFISGDYTGPSWNVFVSMWEWMRRRFGQSHR